MADQLPFDGWGDEFNTFTSGLKDDFDGEIVNAVFGYDAKYNNGKTLCLMLELKDVNEGGEDVRQIYSCGEGWDSAEGGKRAVREDGKKVGFNKNTAVVDFLTNVANKGGEAAKEVLLGNGFTPYYCTPLVGTVWHWQQVEKSYSLKDRDTKEQKTGTSTRLMPVAFVGAGDKKAAPKRGAKKAKNTWDGLDDETIATFKEVAGEVDTYQDFVAKVSDEFEEWPEEAIMDEKFYDFLKG